MKKKILLPTDFSKNAWSALRYASELYKKEEVEFYILTAFKVHESALENVKLPDPGERYFEEARVVIEKQLQKLQKHIEVLDIPNHHSFLTKAIYDTPVLAVKNFVENNDIDLVIVGSKGKADTIDKVLGSNTVEFMEKVRSCPVLVVPPETYFKEPNEIVFPTDFKLNYNRSQLIHLSEISRITDAPIRILHINKSDELTEDQINKKELLETIFDGINYTFHYLENTEVQTGLDIFIQSRESEMIAFINRKHTFFGSIFSRPLVKDLGYNAKVPILALHDSQN
ncbi:universal stress protein [unidentified eubacterium SCB49]|nr:universal stress protein [unidentified eubacterium SCB49]